MCFSQDSKSYHYLVWQSTKSKEYVGGGGYYFFSWEGALISKDGRSPTSHEILIGYLNRQKSYKNRQNAIGPIFSDPAHCAKTYDPHLLSLSDSSSVFAITSHHRQGP
jgi:hypothetical protein